MSARATRLVASLLLLGAGGVSAEPLSRAEAVARALERNPAVQRSLEDLGLANRSHQLAGELSGGWKQRLALAAWYQGARAVRLHGPYAETQTFVANVRALASRM